MDGEEEGSCLTLGDSYGVDVGLPVLVGLVLGWLDGIPLTLGLSEGMGEGCPLTEGEGLSEGAEWGCLFRRAAGWTAFH